MAMVQRTSAPQRGIACVDLLQTSRCTSTENLMTHGYPQTRGATIFYGVSLAGGTSGIILTMYRRAKRWIYGEGIDVHRVEPVSQLCAWYTPPTTQGAVRL